MKCSLTICATFAMAFMLSFNNCISAQNTKQSRDDAIFRSPFRYVIFYNRFEPKLGRKDEDRRSVGVLLDAKSFSKENLIVLFRLVAKRFPKPHLLYIDVFTNLDDAETPEEGEAGGLSETDAPGLTNDNAVFIRANKKAFFYMYFANGDFDEVEIK